MAGNFTYWHELPNTTTIGETMVGAPMQYTNGAFINLFLIGFFFLITIGAVQYNATVKKAAVFSSFSTFIVTFLFSLGGYAGGNQLITAAVVFMSITAYNVMEGRIK